MFLFFSSGVARTTQDEIDFANFAIFDDPAHPYSTFKFTYTHLEFERLSRLIEYNTLLCSEIIFDNISTCIKRRRRFSIRRPCTKKDIARLSLNSRAKVAELENYISMVEKVTEESQQEEASSTSTSSSSSLYSSSLVSSLKISNGKPVVNGGRRGSKEEADLNLKSKPRPISSPVRFLKEVEEEQRKAKKNEIDSGSDGDNDDATSNSRLHRSAVSLKATRTARSRLSSGMSKVIEEGDDYDEPDTHTMVGPFLIDKDTPSRGVLSRSRPVSASMKPTIITERKVQVEEHDSVTITVQATDNDDCLSHSDSLNTNGIHSNSSGTQAPLSPRLAKRANALTPEQRKLNGQISIERSLSTSYPDSEANLLSSTSLSDSQCKEQSNPVDPSQVKDLPAAKIEQLIDVAERVTDL